MLAAGALAGSGQARLDEGLGSPRVSSAPFVPSWLSETFSDGTISLRYPAGWSVGRAAPFGTVISDTQSRHPAFVSIAYLPSRDYRTRAEFAQLATRFLRPPDGRGTTLLYSQTARAGGRRGYEAAVMWAYGANSPLGPTMRVLGFELDSGEVALLVFAAERPRLHRGAFAWVKKTISWSG